MPVWKFRAVLILLGVGCLVVGIIIPLHIAGTQRSLDALASVCVFGGIAMVLTAIASFLYNGDGDK